MISDKEYKKLLKQFHKLSDRHILVVETDMPSSDVQKVVILSDKIRKAGNELVGLMRKNYDQLMRTKKYRKLLKLYGSTNDKKKHRDLANQLNEMQKQYNVTWDHCRNAMIHIGKKYSIDAVFALTKAEDIWRGIEKCLYNNGKTIHFSKYGELPCIRAKQINRGISMSVKDNELKFKLKGNVFGIQVKDRFQTDEVCAVLEYLSRSEIINDKAINKFLDKAYCIDTYRPCYATLVPKFIRGKYRVYLHLTIEGKAKPKYDRFGNPRHKFGKGIIGADIGTQTVAYTSNTEVGLKNLSERGNSIQTSERRERLLITEPKNASKLMKRTKDTTVNSKGKFHKKKRFGKSIKNRCPSGFQTTVERKFKVSGGIYIEVPNNYRASQYDHTADDYIKKKLSDRIYKLTDGTLVQRDWYSSFLLYCYDYRTKDIDKNKCISEFDKCYNKEKALIEWIRANKIKILNSGIKIA